MGARGAGRRATQTQESRYRAPALEKGLDILELLARSRTPLSFARITELVGRSKGELFRMIQVLEKRHYIARWPGDEGYTLTNRLLLLGMEQPPIKNLVEAALPVMHQLAEAIWQSCHLAVESMDQIVVVAKADAPGDIGFSVRIGHRRPLPHSTSGTVLFAFQSEAVRNKWLEFLNEAGVTYDKTLWLDRANQARTQGFAMAASSVVRGVTDISAPILQGESAIGALTVPFVEREGQRMATNESLLHICEAAGRISDALKLGGAAAPGRKGVSVRAKARSKR